MVHYRKFISQAKPKPNSPAKPAGETTTTTETTETTETTTETTETISCCGQGPLRTHGNNTKPIGAQPPSL